MRKFIKWVKSSRINVLITTALSIAILTVVAIVGWGIYLVAVPPISAFQANEQHLVLDINQTYTLDFSTQPEPCRYGELAYISSDSDIVSFMRDPEGESDLSCQLTSFDKEGTTHIYISDTDSGVSSPQIEVRVEDKALIARLRAKAKKVDDVIEALKAPSDLKYEDKDSVVECRAEYNLLGDRAKAYIKSEKILEAAEKRMEQIETELRNEAQPVVDSILSIKTGDLSEAELIKKTRKSYESINSNAKMFVTNLSDLEKAEKTLELYRQADAVDQEILGIGEVTLDKSSTIASASKAYENLSEEAKSKVKHYEILSSATKKVSELQEKKRKEEAEAKRLAALEEQRSTNENTGYGTVYWTPRGKSYHSRTSCPTLSRSKTIRSGSVSEAISSGHGDPCNICAGG